MVVVVLIGVLSAVIIPEMKGTFEDVLLRSTSRELVDVFSMASSRAISLNQLHRVRLDPHTGRYVMEKRVRENPDGDEFAPVKDVPGSEGVLDTRIAIQVGRPGELSPAPQDAPAAEEDLAPQPPIEAIAFYPDGTADATELQLRDRQGFRLALRINPITAHVQIVEMERE